MKLFETSKTRWPNALLVGKKKNLSFAGRSVLIKAVAMALPTYTVQTFLLLKCICEKLDNMVRRFWWGYNDQQQHLYLKSWDRLCSPKMSGGLGFRKFREVNEVFTTKLCWQLCTEPNRFWVKLVRSKYLRGRKVLDFNRCGK